MKEVNFKITPWVDYQANPIYQLVCVTRTPAGDDNKVIAENPDIRVLELAIEHLQQRSA